MWNGSSAYNGNSGYGAGERDTFEPWLVRPYDLRPDTLAWRGF